MNKTNAVFKYGVAICINAISQFFLLAIFSRYLTLEDFGKLSIAQVISAFLISLAGMGLALDFERNFHYYKKKTKLPELFGTYCFTNLINIIIIILSSYVILNVFSFDINKLLFLIIVSHNGLLSLRAYFLTGLKFEYRIKHYVLLNILDSILLFSLGLFFIVILNKGIVGVALSQLLSNTLTFGIYILVFNKYKLTFPTLKSVKNLNASCAKLIPRIFVSQAEKSSDKLFLNSINRKEGVGLLAISSKFSNLMLLITSVFENVFLPKIYEILDNEKNTNSAGSQISKLILPFVYYNVLVAILIIIFGYIYVQYFLGPMYYKVTNLLIFSVTSYSLLLFGKVPILIYKKKYKLLSLLSVLNFAIYILILLPFVYLFEEMGAVIAALLATTLNFFIYLHHTQKEVYVNWNLKLIGLFYCFLLAISFVISNTQADKLDNAPSFALILFLFASYVAVGLKNNYFEHLSKFKKNS